MAPTFRLRTSTRAQSCYHDRIDYDADNRSFFIYDLSRYNNRTYYAYGVTDDIINMEFVLKQSVPVYNLLYHEMLLDNHRNVPVFEEFIRPYIKHLPFFDDRINTFVLGDDMHIEQVVQKLSILFSSHV